MKLAEYCNTATSYIGQIETGRKFPSMEMIEKMASVLRIEPYHFFKNNDKNSGNSDLDIENIYPQLPKSMKNEIKSQLDVSISEIISEILGKY